MGGKGGLVINTHYCTRVKVSNVMICANVGVDISRDIDSGGDTKLECIASTSWLGITTAHVSAAVMSLIYNVILVCSPNFRYLEYLYENIICM